MKIAIDPGTSFIKYIVNDSLVKFRNGYVSLDKSEFILNMCQKMNVNYYEHEDRIFVIGDDGFEIARQLGQPFKRCMSEGRLNTQEVDSIVVLSFIIKSILDRYKDITDKGVIISSPCKDESIDFVYHRSILEDLISGAKIVEEGYACGLGILKEHDFTGIGMSIGGGLINVGLLYKGINTGTFSLRKAVDWVDKQASLMANIRIEKIVNYRENMDMTHAKSLVEKIISSYISHMLFNALYQADEIVSQELENKEVVLGIAGGITEMKGFKEWTQRNLVNCLKRVKIVNVVIGDQFTNCRGIMEYLSIKQ